MTKEIKASHERIAKLMDREVCAEYFGEQLYTEHLDFQKAK